MSRTIIREDGQVTYRTALFASQDKASRFARCLQSNSRFTSVLVHNSQTSKTPKWYVTFQPASESRRDALHAGQQEARQIRAEEQEFIFWADGDKVNVWWCFSVASGETYEVTLGDCSCPDYQFRCRNAGINCKHQLAWSSQRAMGILGQTDKATRPVISREEMARRISQDF